MNTFKNISKNDLYLLKNYGDLFSYDVKLRVQRSKEGGLSDNKIGSWFGAIISMTLLVATIKFCSSRISNMNQFEKVTYNSIEFKNHFGEFISEAASIEAGDILLSNYTFLPSIDSTLRISDSLSL